MSTTTKYRAREIAERCASLEHLGHAPGDAERLAFEEAVARLGSLEPGVYEAFVAPRRRRQHGVYFTPPEVVDAQVRMVEEVLARMGSGFGDPRVLVIDPAAGTGAYPLAIAARGGRAERMVLYEALPGSAAIARGNGLPVQEGDALDVRQLPAAEVMVCIGNPPYRRRSADRRTRELLGRLGESGVHAKNLHNEYVCFWAWAVEHVLLRRAGPGLVSFVSASSYLRGPAFGGLRELLRRELDELWIVDLEGDHLAARRTDNVFPIRTPVAIGMGVRYGAERTQRPADVRYLRLDGDRRAKLDSLRAVRLDGAAWRRVEPDWATALIAPGTRSTSGYRTWPRLTELFPWQISGVQMKRTWPIAPTRELLEARWLALLRSENRAAVFGITRDRSTRSTPGGLAAIDDLSIDASPPAIERYAYRSFDRQWLLCDPRVGDYVRPSLWRSAGPRQIYLTSLLTNVLGPGPAAVATRLVPDMDHFRGSFGARAVIPLWRGAGVPNVAAGVLDDLDTTPEELMTYCYALLGTRGYAKRFEEELRAPGPRIPITRDAALFKRTAALGQQLIELHTYTRVETGAAREVVPIERMPHDFGCADGALHVGDGTIAPVNPEVWAYSVSGMAIVRSWLRRRISPRTGKSTLDAIRLSAWSPALTRELLELLWLVEQTIDCERALDEVLDEVVASSGEWRAPRAAVDQQFGDVLRAQRPGEDEALPLVASELLEPIPL